MQERLTEIEIKLAHLEQSVNELSDVMYRHQGLLERLEQSCENLRLRLDAAGGSEGAQAPEDEKPPHY
jgi:uncharacterized coiled-coil protein SlyX